MLVSKLALICLPTDADVLYVTVYLILMMTVPSTGENTDPGTSSSEDDRKCAPNTPEAKPSNYETYNIQVLTMFCVRLCRC